MNAMTRDEIMSVICCDGLQEWLSLVCLGVMFCEECESEEEKEMIYND